MLRVPIHLALHILVPGVVAKIFYKPHWVKAWLVMLATMLVDLDHLLAIPVFDPNRCSIGFHPLHSYYAIAVYILLFLPKPSRLIAIGLLIHMFLDGIDCYWMLNLV